MIDPWDRMESWNHHGIRWEHHGLIMGPMRFLESPFMGYLGKPVRVLQVMGVIEETDPEKRLAILTHLSEKSSLESTMKVQADFYTSEVRFFGRVRMVI